MQYKVVLPNGDLLRKSLQSIFEFLIEYFSEPEHAMFWSAAIIFFLIGTLIVNRIKRNNTLKKWMKKHNIGKKY